MKKGLFLLPLLGGLLLAGCEFEIAGKKIEIPDLFGSKESTTQTQNGSGTGTGTGTGTNSGTQNGQQSGGNQTVVAGELLATLDMHEDKSISKSAEEVVISDAGVTLTVEKNGAQQDAGGKDQAYVAKPLRVYGGQKVTIEFGSEFSSLVFDCQNFNDNPYAQWFTEAVNQGEYGVAVQDGSNKSKVIVTLAQPATSWSYVNEQLPAGWKQNRFYSVELHK